MKEFAKQFYNSQAWKNTRASFISYRMSKDGGQCQVCHESLGFIVHHKIELNAQNINDAYVSLSFSNLQYVCLECHNRIHGHFNSTAVNEVCFTENGDVLPAPIQI